MEVSLKKAVEQNSEQIYKMQIIGFKALLDKYKDFDTNPGAETLERITQRFKNNNTDHYFIQSETINIGYIRIVRLDKHTCRLSQMFILPDYQGKGYAQQTIHQVENLYPQTKKWELDTIKQEKKLCHLYEKMGYCLTGKVKRIKHGMDLVDYVKFMP